MPTLRRSGPAELVRTLLIALPLAVLAPAAALAQTDGLAEAQKLLKQGQAQQALDKLDAYIVGKPKDPQGRFLKGIALTEMNRGADAIAVFSKLTEDFPELPEPYNNLAVLYAQLKQYDKARAALEMAIRTHPSYAIAHENLGDVYAKLASQAYDKALQLDSSNAAASTKLSLIRDLIGGKPASGKGKAAEPIRVATAEPAKAAPAAKTADAPVQAPAEAKPAAAVTAPSVAPSGNAVTDIESAVNSWARAWSNKDVTAYLQHYAKTFDPPGRMSREAWEAQRHQRVNKPGDISVELSNLEITVLDADNAKARFRQAYRSANFTSDANKTLTMVREAGSWRIREEDAR
jgi:tetratricopeptide (TPR) repeat protein